ASTWWPGAAGSARPCRCGSTCTPPLASHHSRTGAPSGALLHRTAPRLADRVVPGPSRGEGGEDLLGATHADLRIGVRGTDLRVEVQVHEQLGESSAGEAVDVAADLLEGALQPWPVVLTVRRRRLRLAHPHHTAAHEPQRV